MDDSPIENQNVLYVESVNHKDTISELVKINPSIIIINGTRIISKKVLNSVKSKFVNMHAGITPQYRGVHGGYWALVDRNPELCGVTIHLVDPGIDTGDILEQKSIRSMPGDNYSTYPLIQLGTGIPLLIKNVTHLLEGRINLKSGDESNSKLWSHPTLWQYLWYRIFRGVK
jgi:methionyl-tRNA formyltransferase